VNDLRWLQAGDADGKRGPTSAERGIENDDTQVDSSFDRPTAYAFVLSWAVMRERV
jgi:hypothetical protein